MQTDENLNNNTETIEHDVNAPAMIERLLHEAGKKNVTSTEIRSLLRDRYGVTRLRFLTLTQYKELSEIIKHIPMQ